MSELGVTDFDRKLAQLLDIERVLHNASMTGPKPREYLQLASAFAAAMLSMSLASKFFEDAIVYDTELIIASTVLGGIAGLMAFIRCVPAPKSDLELLDDLITEYEPVHEAAYAALQRSARSARALVSTDVSMWVEREEEAIRGLLPIPKGPGTKFMNKTLSFNKESNDE